MVIYVQSEKKFFVEFKPRFISHDPLTRAITALDDYPYTSIREYKDITSPVFLSLFTTDGVEGSITIPKTSKYGETKYVITRKTNPNPDYLILCTVSVDGTVTCRIGNEIMNPECKNVLFSIHIKKIQVLIEYGKFLPYQTRRNYSFDLYWETLVKKFKNQEYDLKTFMSDRHDLIQIAIAQYFGLNLHLGTSLDLSIYGLYSKQTPDFFELVGDDALIGDIAIVTDTTNTEIYKFDKYSGLIQQLTDKGKKVIPFFLIFNHSFTNFYEVVRSAPIQAIEDSCLSEVCHGELEEMFQILKVRYPLQIDESTGVKYAVPKVDPSSTYNYIKDNLTHLNDDEIIKKYFSGKLIREYKDKEFKIEALPEIFNQLEQLNKSFKESVKPSHYVPVPPDDFGFETILGRYSEQQMLLKFFQHSVNDEVYKAFAKDLDKALFSCGELGKKMFTVGKYTENEDELREEFHKVRKNESFEDFLKTKGFIVPNKGDAKIPYPKMLHMSSECMREIATFLQESGQDYRSTHVLRERKEKTTVNIENAYHNVEQFLSLLSSTSSRDWSEDFFTGIGDDEQFATKVKKEYSKMAKSDIKTLGKTYCYKYLRFNSLLYEQLIHYSNLSMVKKRFVLFNSGLPNICGVMRCGYRGMAQQVGKPFMFMGFTKNVDFVSSGMFGKLTVVPFKDGFFFRTRWFRLPNFRLEFFRDQYYSILASSFATLARIRNLRTSSEQIRGVFCLRTLVGLIANQKAMEKLADARYAIMSSFATHTNFEELIIEKFSPPYKSNVEAWIVKRLIDQLPDFRRGIYESNNIKINTPVLDHLDRRFQQSTGGKFKIKAIWSDRKLYTLQDLLDELFLYVHTPKEPSTAFHEEINAIKTIQKFQESFDNMTYFEKCGVHDDPKEWLMSKSNIGFEKDFLLAASIHYKNNVNFDLNRIERFIAEESFGELTSTKSVIPDITRKIKPVDKHHKYRVNDCIAKFGKLTTTQREYIEHHEKDMKDTKNRSTAEIYHGRTKVHDEVLTYVTHFNEPTVLQNALMYMYQPNCEVLTDICIKAQYGAKREFYVMNMGAKVMARVVENFYKTIAKSSDTEMISIAGDRKLIHMQSMMDRTIKHALNNKNLVYYCNGDCTKWSAAETMEAFHVLTEGICTGWDSDFKEVIQYIIHLWTKKSIQIPLNIISKVLPLSKQTEYLIEASKNSYKMPSTQNFLQGVFNYMSSIKADVCNRYTIHLWNKFYGGDKQFYVEYLVHSDDYVFAFSSPTVELIEEFRAFHKICMRLCGITDSSKKTNVQPIFMEFISLVCFNGSMAYPTIKKTKEVATTLPCESFSGDSDMVCSRTGECVRVGVDYYSAWVFHRIHMSLLRRAYSMHEGGENYIEDCVNIPVQMFGQSDMHPIFYFLCKGDPNNLRIFNFTKNSILLKKLYTLDSFKDSLKSVHSSFREPTFIYNNYTKRITKLRESVGMSIEEAMEFWEKNLVYNFVKPRTTKHLKKWLQAMYFKSSFIKAYNRDTRTTRLLRLSMFSKGKCVTYKTDEELNVFYFELSKLKDKFKRQEMIKKEMFTIKELYQIINSFETQDIDDRDIQIAILMGDSTSDLIYQWMQSASLIKTHKINTFNTCATYSPYKATWLSVSQPVDQVICYGVDEQAFLENFGLTANVSNVKADFEKLKSALPGLFEFMAKDTSDYSMKMRALQVAYNTYVNNLPRYQVCMSSKRHRQNIVDFLSDSFKYSHDPIYIYDVVSNVIHMEMNPYTLVRHNIIGTERTVSSLKLLCNNMPLAYIYLLAHKKMSVQEASDVLSETLILDFGLEMTFSKYLSRYTYQMAKLEGLTYIELLCFAFLKKLINNDNLPLSIICSDKNYYNYTYIEPQTFNKDTGKYEGNMVAHINFENVSSVVTLFNDDFWVATDTKSALKAEFATLIGMKLSSQISEKAFYKAMSKPTSKYAKTIVAKRDGLYCVLDGTRYKYQFKAAGESYVGLPCFFDARLKTSKVFMKKDTYMLSTNYRIERGSVMIDNRKLFNLPYKNLHYTHIDMVAPIDDVALFNEIIPFFVLNKPINEKLDVVKIVKLVDFKSDVESDFDSFTVKKKKEVKVMSIEEALGDFDFFSFKIQMPEGLDLTYRPDMYDDHEEIVQPVLPVQDYEDLIMDEYEESCLEQSPFDRFVETVKLVERKDTATIVRGSLYDLEGKKDLMKEVLMEVTGMRETYFLSPLEYLYAGKTVANILKCTEYEWLKPFGEILKDWLAKTVKIAPSVSYNEGFAITIEDGQPKVYKSKQVSVKTAKKFDLKTGGEFICSIDYSEMEEDEIVTYYKLCSLDDYFERIQVYEPLSFYKTKKDELYKVLKTFALESLTL